MRFLLDENFPKAVIPLLQNMGHDCLDLRDMENEGADDSVVFETAIRYDATLLTTDRDFFHTIPHLFPEHPGAIVVALRQPDRQSILNRITWFLNHFPNRSLHNKVFELRDRAYLSREK